MQPSNQPFVNLFAFKKMFKNLDFEKTIFEKRSSPSIKMRHWSSSATKAFESAAANLHGSNHPVELTTPFQENLSLYRYDYTLGFHTVK